MADNWIQKIAFELYDLSWRIVIPWLRLNHRLSEGFEQRTLKNILPSADLWIQAASVGESNLALEIIKTLRINKAIKILVTSNTRQGFDILKETAKSHYNSDKHKHVSIGYFPFDKPAIMQKAVADVRPVTMVLLETEIWPGLLYALKKSGCNILIVNGRLTAKSLKRYLLWPTLWQILKPDKVLAISPKDADRFGRLFGQDRVEIMPNIKFDRIASTPSTEVEQAKINAIVPGDIPFVVLASVRRQEESFVKKIVRTVLNNKPETVIGLFPRHMHRLHYWQNALNSMGIRNTLRSKAKEQVTAGTVILWDSFGELVQAYRISRSAFVGGSLAPLGGQNFLEALVSGVMPIIGPSWDNFDWVGSEIINTGLLRVAGDWKEVAKLLLQDIDGASFREEVIEKTLNFVKARRGGTEIACRHIVASLERNLIG
jgi:3-deoxy-D-manno-octulosonic-acid transferase